MVQSYNAKLSHNKISKGKKKLNEERKEGWLAGRHSGRKTDRLINRETDRKRQMSTKTWWYEPAISVTMDLPVQGLPRLE